MSVSSLWPYTQAQRIIDSNKEKDVYIFETGYGPSGLPHIGTFGEVVRTNWVRQAFTEMTGLKSKLITFSDDMDALRKTPDNIDNSKILDVSHGLSLSKVPNPFNTEYNSFGEHNNAMLMKFLNNMNIEYEFASSTNYYTSGKFNKALTRMAECHDEICKIVRPTLRGQRSEEWSPFMPIHPLTGKVMTVPVIRVDSNTGTITWIDDNSDQLQTSIYNGNCKIQWKADWALRWYALGVDYEMSGKDLIDSVKLSSKICRILGGTPPINLTYELFLDEEGQKISKSKGNGMTYEEWIDICSEESLQLFMFNNPTRAKKIGPNIAIMNEEEYIKNNNTANSDNEDIDMNNPVGNFIKSQGEMINITYGMIINIVSASSATSSDEIWSYLLKYRSDLDRNNPYINELVTKAITYYNKYVLPTKNYRSPTDVESNAIEQLMLIYENYGDDIESEERYQYYAFEVGKSNNFNLRDWFKTLYEVLLGQSSGPRFGVFVAGYGRENTVNLMKEKLNKCI